MFELKNLSGTIKFYNPFCPPAWYNLQQEDMWFFFEKSYLLVWS